ncbi:MAG: 2-hydroxyacyl-CoA dehydratase [Deltaproteobacteria bacterium]|nr:2-hydroxyacyl-CoA dehydratase [Deltaproteobacteria bacterium]
MDEKKEKSLSRIREEIAMYEPIVELLELDPGEMGHLQLPILRNSLKQSKKTVACIEKDLPLIASQYTNPVEILTAMDVHWYFHIEQMFAASGSGGSPHIMQDLEEADKLPIPNDCCTLIRLALYYQVAGLFPIPTAYLALTEPCDSVAGWHAAFMHHPDWRGVPVFAPDPPYHNDDRAIAYYADEMRRMVDFITEHTGKTLDIDRLREVVEETNKGYALWMEYNEIRRNTPTPHSYIMPMSCFYQINTAGAGDPEKTKWYHDMVADAEMRVRENKPEVPDQKIRLFWYDIQPFYFGEIVPWLETEWGGVIAMDMISYCPFELIDTSTEDSLFRGLAKRAFQDGPMIHQARGLADNVVHDITRIVKDYKIDCVIFPGHMGHKDMAASTSIMRETCRDLGVAFLHLGLDVADKRYATVDELKDKMSQFFTAMGLG